MAKMNKDIPRKMGNIGEKAVERLLETTRSDDWYDPEKDGTQGDKTYEVKTHRLNGSTNGFWISENQSETMWKKLDGVDFLYFIMVPEEQDELAPLYICHDHRNCFKLIENKGVQFRSYPVAKCETLGYLTKKESRTLYDLSKKISKFKGNRK
jgi:hypothetical protein